MEGSELLKDDSIEVITYQIQRTISNLNMKRNMLVSQIDKYKNLQETISEKSEKIMVLLGDGYFVEKSPKDSREFLSRRMRSMNETSREFNNRIEEANRTMNQLAKLKEIQSNEKEDSLNEEGLPFMDIQEELDEEDNIKNTKINNRVQENEKKIRELDTNDDSLSNRGKEKDLNEEDLPLMEIEEELDDEDNIKSIKINNKVQTNTNCINKARQIKSIDPASSKQNSLSQTIPNEESGRDDSNDEDQMESQMNELLEDMEIIKVKGKTSIEIDEDELLEKIDQLKINPDDKFRLKQICVESFQELEEKKSLDGIENKSEDQLLTEIIQENGLGNILSSNEGVSSPSSTKEQGSIDTSELLELELMADEFDEKDEHARYADDEEWDFEFEDDTDEDEDGDYADELLYGNERTKFIPQGASQSGEQDLNSLLWKQIIDLRSKNDQTYNAKDPSSVEKSKKKKSVRFSEKLEVNEIENISDELKNINHVKQNISKFMQNRLSKRDRAGTDAREVIDSRINNLYQPVNDDIEREPISDFKRPVSDIVEREPIIFEEPVNDIVEREPISIEGPVSDIMEREPVSDITEREPISNIKETISDIIEREPVTDISERNEPTAHGSIHVPNNKPRQSRFKQMATKNVPLQRNDEMQKKDTESFNINDIEQGRTRRDVIQESIQEVEDKQISVVDSTLDYQNMQHDLDTMAKAYNLGMYDDDIMTEGPVVDELDDFSKINKIIESMPKNETPKKLQKPQKTVEQFDPYLDQVGEIGAEDSDDDNVPTLTDIVENDIAHDTDVEQTILDQEVAANYYKLRQKLLFSKNETGQDNKEFEPIDTEGNPVRVSRFKASKYK